MIIAEKVRPQEFVKYGRRRDQQIVELIANSGPYTRDQIQALIFPRHRGTQKCNQRLYKLVQLGKIKRVRLDKDEQYIYFTGKWNQKSEHTIMVNWVYTAVVSQMKSWFKLHTFTREYCCKWGDSKRLLADALLVLKNTAQNTLRPVFIEVDRAENSSPFTDKLNRYTEYYLSREWTGQWWAKKDAEGYFTFPKVLVVAERPLRVDNAIEKGNKEKLRFNVATLDQVRADIYRFI